MFSLILFTAPAWSADPVHVPAPEPYALLQVWITAYDMDEAPQADPAGYGDPEDDPGIKLRRARLGFEGTNSRLRYGLVVGTAAPYDAVQAQGGSSTGLSVSIVDAYGGFAPLPQLWVVAGWQRVPVSRETLFSAQDQVFQEGAVSSEWLTPGRDAGLIVDSTLGPARVRLGAFNGNHSLLGDDGAGKLLSARAEVTVGQGDAYQTYGAVDGFTLGYGMDGFVDQDVATTTLNAGTDLLVRVAGLAFLAEARYAGVRPSNTDVAQPEVLDATKRLGAMAQVGYTVGGFEPAVRFSMYDDDMDASDNGDLMNATVGVTWHGLDDAVRVGAGYVLRLESGGRSLPNDTARLWMQLAL